MLFTAVPAFAEAPRTVLTETFTIFGGSNTPPVILNSTRDWTIVSVIDWSAFGRSSQKHGARMWRLLSRYTIQGTGGPVTVQIRIRSQNNVSVFTHPWGQNIQDTTYSNWFEDIYRQVDSSSRSIVEAKLFAPPRVPVQGVLYAVSMEAWDTAAPIREERPHSQGMNVDLAYFQPPETARAKQRQPTESEIEAALKFALSFIEACIEGDLAAYYRFINDSVYSLDSGSPLSKYRIAPPGGIPGILSIEEYKNRFDCKIYNVDDFETMFPEWFNTAREWIPGPKTLLFMGHTNRSETVDLTGVDFLVFLMERDSSGEWKVIARPEQ